MDAGIVREFDREFVYYTLYNSWFTNWTPCSLSLCCSKLFLKLYGQPKMRFKTVRKQFVRISGNPARPKGSDCRQMYASGTSMYSLHCKSVLMKICIYWWKSEALVRVTCDQPPVYRHDQRVYSLSGLCYRIPWCGFCTGRTRKQTGKQKQKN